MGPSPLKGLPYAQPPLGDLRFASPKPVNPWGETKTLDVSDESPKCMQTTTVISPETKFIYGQEDCLYLNIFTPRPHMPEGGQLHLPVIAWIHGGAFCVGDNGTKIYGPDYLLDYDVVLVTINYRYL